eukprot:m.56188 g.56188  ORF g.56188 m.56188 type:complete len:256 (-) comp6988_c0_seq1:2066-2833(-)
MRMRCSTPRASEIRTSMLLMTRFYTELQRLSGQRGAAPRALRAAQSWLQTLTHGDLLLPVEELAVKDHRAGAVSVSAAPELRAVIEGSSSEARSATLRAVSAAVSEAVAEPVSAAEMAAVAEAMAAQTARLVSVSSVEVAGTARRLVRAVLAADDARPVVVEGVYDGSMLASARAAAVSADSLRLQLPPGSISVDVEAAQQLLEPWLACSTTRGPGDDHGGLPDWFQEPTVDLSKLAFDCPIYWAPFVVLGAGFS